MKPRRTRPSHKPPLLYLLQVAQICVSLALLAKTKTLAALAALAAEAVRDSHPLLGSSRRGGSFQAAKAKVEMPIGPSSRAKAPQKLLMAPSFSWTSLALVRSMRAAGTVRCQGTGSLHPVRRKVQTTSHSGSKPRSRAYVK